MTVRVELPLKTPNMTNRREHHMARAKRQKKQRDATRLVLQAKLGGHWRSAFRAAPDTNLVVTLTRVSPGSLDAHDNLRSALKSVVDGVADYFGLDDADPRIEWVYRQAKGPAAVVLEFDVRTVGVVDPGPEAVAE